MEKIIEYPFKSKISEIVNSRKRTLGWLFGEIDKSDSWYHKLGSIGSQQLQTIEKLSSVLEFDFVKDYYEWKGEPLGNLHEPDTEYEKTELRQISVQITVSGEEKKIIENVGKILDQLSVKVNAAGLKLE